ncbi:uncharacterized protein BT62DRAFT_1073682 [Guyanagaster necrorhizus]|uniref:Uncharacterized protein n=1 Tax=Guyanagaster necrorhizus TaxID=856835 RepID=A0A9P8AVJ6_9AGAR|nr:uncharacterized protein BT62DRAFT_1073682 [Guyanagaster necrorhizus MCA 3950]KAG7449166.1 hypothetical protein BT62DRAFT_1073682 [Guyanagaster necrorhizus MCA 3950]
MATPNGQQTPHTSASSDLEQRAARILDPGIDLKTRFVVATEIREILDTLRDADASRALPFIIPPLVELLQSGEVSFRKESLEFQFRSIVLSILTRLPISEHAKPHVQSIYNCLLCVIRQDNEENGVSACKHIVELVRAYRMLTEENLRDFTSLFKDVFANIKPMTEQLLSEGSAELDPAISLPSIKSFKVTAELGLLMAMFSQIQRDLIRSVVQVTIPPAFEVLCLEAPAQKKAREEFEAAGGFWAGMAPTITNPGSYGDFVNAQIKMLSYLAFIMRFNPESSDVHGETLVLHALRILQDCPMNGIPQRKELMVVFRHLMGTPYRKALLPQIDKLFDERVLLGTCLGANELLRATVYTAFTDLFHHVRNDLTSAQLERIVHVYSRQIHNPALTINLHTLSAKMMFGTAEAIIAKETPQGAARILELMFKSCLDRLDALTVVHENILAALERAKAGQEVAIDDAFIEKARPVGGAAYALEKPEDVVNELRLFFKTLLHGFRVCLAGLRKCEAPTPDGTLIFRMFEGCVHCLANMDNDNRTDAANDAIDWFSPILSEINLHVFQEVWTHKMEFFFECAQKRVALLGICSYLFNREATSPTLLAIVLQFLVDRLPMLGEYEDLVVATTIRLYKTAFAAVASHPATNESILALHLGKLLMDCFPLAAKATKPTHYFHLLRALFRSIGGGGGRFELLYKEVLPLLPEMLECLNRQLHSSEGATRDMIVELCLTVPLRLTHLLPHLSYLMQPLALALKGSTELVTQGLRTLELCIDNLTPDFLDPTLNLVLRELMEALHSHLKPLPANHILAHSTMRILGKLGGRNRRLLTKEPCLKYQHHSEHPKMTISFSGKAGKVDLGPAAVLARQTLTTGTPADVTHAYEYLERCLSFMLYEGIKGDNAEQLFVSAMEGIFDATHVAQTQEQAEQFVKRMGQRIFELETRRPPPRDVGTRQAPSTLLSAFIDAVPHALAREQAEEAKKANLLVASVIQNMVNTIDQQSMTLPDVTPILHQFSTRFIGLCFGDSWIRKRAGCNGIRIMTSTMHVGASWTVERELEIMRALLHVLKDLPADLPRDTEEIVDVLTTVLRIGNANLDYSAESGHQNCLKLINLVGQIFPELQSSNAVVRQAAQTSIALLVEFSGSAATQLLMPHRDRMLGGIYNKPLRALPFSIQIGMIEAVRYCVSLDPPLVEVNDELLRLLHETLALADADDSALVGRGNVRQSSIEVTKLHVACIKLLTASMPLTDFFSKQHQTRQRVTSVYFKALYSPSHEIKAVAYDGLKMVLAHQNRLPRELLQTGLRPILMNLADPKRLSVPGLEGLARLLALLTNYFKVEIGHKLLDHFRVVADPQMLQASSRLPLVENEGITKLVRLANIFHLLPSSANIFLDNLINAIVQTEAQMHFSGRSPFSEPLARYLNRYPAEGIDFFLRHLNFPRHLRTLRSILQAKLAPRLESDLASRTSIIVAHFIRGGNNSQSLPALLLFMDLASIAPSWVQQHAYAIDALVDVWHADVPEQDVIASSEVVERQSIIISIFKTVLEQCPRIDLVFEIVSVYTRTLETDLIRTTHFLYKHVALSYDVIYRRNILMRFLTWFDNPSYTWSHKAYFIRYIVTPTLIVQASRSKEERLVGLDFVERISRMIWRRIADPKAFQDTDDMFKIELLHFTTVMVKYYPDLMEHARKDVQMCSWHYIGSTDDPIVKQAAYLLNAHFFAAYPSPYKFIMRTWTGLLRNTEGRGHLRQEALATLAPALQAEAPESGYPQWAVTARRMLSEDGGSSHFFTLYTLIIKDPSLFYPVRGLFVIFIANSLPKLGLTQNCTLESRNLSIDILQIIFDWENQAEKEQEARMDVDGAYQKDVWLTPMAYRENMVSYLVRLGANLHETPAKNHVVPRALTLLKVMVGPNGWTDVQFGLRFFLRSLEQIDLNTEQTIALAVSSAKVLQVICAEQSDAWYTKNASILQQLVKKGMITDENDLHDALGPIFDRLLDLFPLPKEEEDQPGELSEFHSFIYSAVGEALRNATTVRGALTILQSVVKTSPERIESFAMPLVKILTRLTKEHAQPGSKDVESTVRLIITIIDICQTSIAFLADQRRLFLTSLVALAEKSKTLAICRYILDLARTWALVKQDSYPTSKDKANLLNKMGAYESRGDSLFNLYLELIYEILTEPSLRRSDLTTRLEPAFLLGCRAKDPSLRERYMGLLDSSVPRSLFNRMTYIFGVQNWEILADNNWIYLALHLLLGAADNLDTPNPRSLAISAPLVPHAKTQDIVRSLQRLSFLDPQTAHNTWVSIFPAAWSCLSRREQADITYHMIVLLSKDYHTRQAHVRPNVIETLLSGIHACSPPMTLPPHLVKYLAKTFGCWYVALEILGASMDTVKDDEPNVRDFVYDSLADVYAELAEDDLFYGVWRRRCLYSETNIALSFEQNGMWEQASTAYETAQSRLRSGTIPFSETEYCLWEDHWILSAEKLQQWEILYDLGRSDSNPEMMLECAWRLKDWMENRAAMEDLINQLPEVPTPRRRVFEAFLSLLKTPAALDKNTEFTRILEDGVQLTLRKWVGLPSPLSAAHIPLLQHFQQSVELQEAVQIFGSLSQTTSQNLEKKSSELKMVLQAWRERLPNLHDDIGIWSDLVAWRQNVFNAINNAYIPLIGSSTQGGNGGASNANTFGYRGYHETAWIINRFAHVARKHDLLEACFTSLAKIYTLPNIEISEAFLKLREQARCYYQKPSDLQAGLEVINNTNLHYFSNAQKAEFFTLKGLFYARFNRREDANIAFGQAVQMDMNQAKSWAEWGRWNDRMFKESNQQDLSCAANAVSCYLQAAGLYKSGKARPLLGRVLWLLSLDDSTFTISRAFDTYKGDASFWFWITLIPQLCQSISLREVKQARYLLLNLARHYPQALFFHLRTTREEMQAGRKAAAIRAAALAGQTVPAGAVIGQTSNDTHPPPVNAPPQQQNEGNPASEPSRPPSPWEYVEEIVQILKAAFPLLLLSLETMLDQLLSRFKPSNDEDIYRHICLLLQDGSQHYLVRMNSTNEDVELPVQTTQTLQKIAQNMPGRAKASILYKDYEDDFVNTKLTLYEYIHRLQQWRDRYEKILDARPRFQTLDILSHYLTEFQYSKVDEIEVPGQYTEEKDNNQNFVKILKFSPKFENWRTHGLCSKRITMIGSDNSSISFCAQQPPFRHNRREERIMQLCRTFNGVLARKKETRKRNLAFHLPTAVLCSSTFRLYHMDASYVSFGDIYDLHCEATGISREDPILYSGEKVRRILREAKQTGQVLKPEYLTLKKLIFDEITAKMVPEDIITRYMIRTMDGPSELWRMRKQFALQVAACSFMTYLLCVGGRLPSRFYISRSTGQIAMTELLPSMTSNHPQFATSDVVPFRLTPNMQHFMSPIFMEGILATSLMSMGRCLTEPEYELEPQLYLYVRDEVLVWMRGTGKHWNPQQTQSVTDNVKIIVKRAEVFACKIEREQALQGVPLQVPVMQTVINLIATATNPVQLSKMGELYSPWY